MEALAHFYRSSPFSVSDLDIEVSTLREEKVTSCFPHDDIEESSSRTGERPISIIIKADRAGARQGI